ncbi:hypothetical protein BN2475_820009 [Paraburkholderia ribeironis]|uniref:Uncharacterized protein n=1 Tax=Paraburkholderia ribeironis TaxID=1247936 RepID=A0A1N7SK82_9BURK|nr:hypothetical protein BN2475_820009 [Paraburkholderia ribeironis]
MIKGEWGKVRVSWITTHRAGTENLSDALQSDAAVVPQVDHRIGEGLERVVKKAEAFEAQQ